MKRLLRKIHLWLSVPFGIIITLVCLSGAMMVYEKEITEWWQADLYRVKEVKARPLPLDSLMRLAEAALPDSVEITGVAVSPSPARPYQVSLSKPRRASMFIDQYTGEVKGHYRRLPLFDTMFRLHRWLLGPSQSADGGLSAGKWLVGTATLAMVFILITGILMWLTSRHKPLAKSLTICLTRGWGRFWHDLHVAGGIYSTVFLLAIALTGLTWSFAWYRTGFYALCGVEQQADGGHGRQEGHQDISSDGRRGGHGANEPDGAYRHAEGGEDSHRGHGYHGGGNRDGAFADHGGDGFGGHHRRSPYRHWQNLLEEAQKQHPGYRQITLKPGTLEVVPEGRRSLRAADKYEYDRRSGEITATRAYADEERSVKVRSAVYTVHTGSWGGWLTRLVTFLAALLGATLPLTGYYLWIRRLLRKRKSAGQPAAVRPAAARPSSTH